MCIRDRRWEHGYFSAWRHLRDDQPDVVLFLADDIPGGAARRLLEGAVQPLLLHGAQQGALRVVPAGAALGVHHAGAKTSIAVADLRVSVMPVIQQIQRGQPAMPCITPSIAWRGEGGSCGHHQVTPGLRACTRAATFCAFADSGEDRKPWR